MLQITNLSKSFNSGTDNEIKVFNDFNLNIEKGKCTALLGSNGCGKSTLMNMIAGSIKPDNGNIYINSKDVTNLTEEKRSGFLARVYQDPSMGVSPSLTILENMSLADKKGSSFSLRKLINKNRIDYYKDLLKDLDLGLEKIMDTPVLYLSGGQRQSLSLVMATMKHPDLLLLDEHTAALDPKTSSVVMRKTKELIDRHSMTTIMISHNMRDAIEFSDRIVMLDNGRIILDRPSSSITEEELNRIYRDKLKELVA